MADTFKCKLKEKKDTQFTHLIPLFSNPSPPPFLRHQAGAEHGLSQGRVAAWFPTLQGRSDPGTLPRCPLSTVHLPATPVHTLARSHVMSPSRPGLALPGIPTVHYSVSVPWLHCTAHCILQALARVAKVPRYILPFYFITLTSDHLHSFPPTHSPCVSHLFHASTRTLHCSTLPSHLLLYPTTFALLYRSSPLSGRHRLLFPSFLVTIFSFKNKKVMSN